MQYKMPFMAGLAHQKYLIAEAGIIEAANSGCSHWYIDGSLHGQMVDDWSIKTINNIKKLMVTHSCQPI